MTIPTPYSGPLPAQPAFWHMGLAVSDIHRSMAFYCDILGLPASPVVYGGSPEYDRVTRNVGAEVAVAYLQVESVILQLVQYVKAGGRALEVRHNNVGSPHFSFFVTDVDATHDAMVRLGVPIISEVVTNGSGTNRSFYCTDPDGVPVELVQRLAA